MNSEHKKTPRVYRKITPTTVALHQAQAILEGNNTSATRTLEPVYQAPQARAHRIVKKSKDTTALEYIESSIEQIGGEAIERIGQMVHSEDERIATKNAHYIVDHIRGKAVQRSISVTGRLNIQSVLD